MKLRRSGRKLTQVAHEESELLMLTIIDELIESIESETIFRGEHAYGLKERLLVTDGIAALLDAIHAVLVIEQVVRLLIDKANPLADSVVPIASVLGVVGPLFLHANLKFAVIEFTNGLREAGLVGGLIKLCQAVEVALPDVKFVGLGFEKEFPVLGGERPALELMSEAGDVLDDVDLPGETLARGEEDLEPGRGVKPGLWGIAVEIDLPRRVGVWRFLLPERDGSFGEIEFLLFQGKVDGVVDAEFVAKSLPRSEAGIEVLLKLGRVVLLESEGVGEVDVEGYWMLDTRCSMLDARCSILDTGCWMRACDEILVPDS